MTLTEAVNILDQAASMAPVPRRDHVAIQKAVDELKKYVAEHEKAQEDHG
jgi:hypothetical protein